MCARSLIRAWSTSKRNERFKQIHNKTGGRLVKEPVARLFKLRRKFEMSRAKAHQMAYSPSESTRKSDSYRARSARIMYSTSFEPAVS